MILAAGRGSRLAPLTDELPKPLLDVHGQPLIERQVVALAAAGYERVVINLFHLGQMIEAALGDGSRFGVEIVYSREPEPLETGGALAYARDLLGEAPFALINGDIWTDFDFAALPTPGPHVDAHLVLTPATAAQRDEGDFALAHRRVHRPQAVADRTWVYCGISAMTCGLIGDRTGRHSLREPLFVAAAAGRLSGQAFYGEWIDIGTPAQLRRARGA
ncbi:MAG: nucleotidyltransferase family protein [Pseudomonadota bacterium]